MPNTEPTLDSVLTDAFKGFTDTPATEEPAVEEAATEAADETPAVEEAEEPSLEVDGVKLTLSEVKALKAAAAKADDLERQMEEASTDRERLDVWRRMDLLAQKHPAIRDKIIAAFSEYESELPPDPIDNRTDEQKLRDSQLDSLLARENARLVAEAGTEIDGFVKDYAEKFPDIVKFDDKWMSDTLLPTVVELFGDGPNVTAKHIKAALNHLAVEKGGFRQSAEKGAKELAERLAKEPPGTRIVKGGAPRSAAEAPAVSIKGKDVDETLMKGLRSMTGQLLTG